MISSPSFHPFRTLHSQRRGTLRSCATCKPFRRSPGQAVATVRQSSNGSSKASFLDADGGRMDGSGGGWIRCFGAEKVPKKGGIVRFCGENGLVYLKSTCWWSMCNDSLTCTVTYLYIYNRFQIQCTMYPTMGKTCWNTKALYMHHFPSWFAGMNLSVGGKESV